MYAFLSIRGHKNTTWYGGSTAVVPGTEKGKKYPLLYGTVDLDYWDRTSTSYPHGTRFIPKEEIVRCCRGRLFHSNREIIEHQRDFEHLATMYKIDQAELERRVKKEALMKFIYACD